MINDKKNLRQKMKNIRKKISNKDFKSKIIVHQIINSDIYRNSNIIALYKSLIDEVQIDDLILDSIENGKIVLLPKIVNDTLVFYKYHLYDNLEKCKYGILEPLTIQDNLYDGVIDLMIIPGLAFDKNNNRLGYGKGYYDRYLRNNNVYNSIGVCFSEQLIHSVPVNENDVKLDLVITEKNLEIF